MKFLIDECLSPALVRLAHAAGYGESSHVGWLDLAGMKDWALKSVILDNDWTFVTRNAVDFRGSPTNPGEKGQYAGVELHAGLICINLPDGSRRSDQESAFQYALDKLADRPDLVNEVIEVWLSDAGLAFERYPLPK